MMENLKENDKELWYVMRDLKRPNAKHPAYKQLEELGFQVFIPMKWFLSVKQGKADPGKKAVYTGFAVCTHDMRQT